MSQQPYSQGTSYGYVPAQVPAPAPDTSVESEASWWWRLVRRHLLLSLLCALLVLWYWLGPATGVLGVLGYSTLPLAGVLVALGVGKELLKRRDAQQRQSWLPWAWVGLVTGLVACLVLTVLPVTDLLRGAREDVAFGCEKLKVTYREREVQDKDGYRFNRPTATLLTVDGGHRTVPLSAYLRTQQDRDVIAFCRAKLAGQEGAARLRVAYYPLTGVLLSTGDEQG